MVDIDLSGFLAGVADNSYLGEGLKQGAGVYDAVNRGQLDALKLQEQRDLAQQRALTLELANRTQQPRIAAERAKLISSLNTLSEAPSLTEKTSSVQVPGAAGQYRIPTMKDIEAVVEAQLGPKSGWAEKFKGMSELEAASFLSGLEAMAWSTEQSMPTIQMAPAGGTQKGGGFVDPAKSPSRTPQGESIPLGLMRDDETGQIAELKLDIMDDKSVMEEINRRIGTGLYSDAELEMAKSQISARESAQARYASTLAGLDQKNFEREQKGREALAEQIRAYFKPLLEKKLRPAPRVGVNNDEKRAEKIIDDFKKSEIGKILARGTFTQKSADRKWVDEAMKTWQQLQAYNAPKAKQSFMAGYGKFVESPRGKTNTAEVLSGNAKLIEDSIKAKKPSRQRLIEQLAKAVQQGLISSKQQKSLLEKYGE